jgi:hypothetical protein
MDEKSQPVEELLGYLDETRARLQDTIAEINPALIAIKPDGDAWSAELIVEHLAKVEEGLAAMIERSVQWARANGVGPASPVQSVLSRLDKFRIIDAVATLSAPETVAPGGSLPVDQSLARLRASREKLRAALVSGSDLDLTGVKRPHRAMGDLDMLQWALFVAHHEERHRRQIERTIVEVTKRCAECAPIV